MAERTTSFNLQALKRVLGFKAQDAMTFGQNVTPTIQVADLSSVSPAHVPPTGSAGANLPAVVGEDFAIEVRSLGAGGCFIYQVTASGSALGFTWGVRQVELAGLVALTTQITSQFGPVQSRARAGTVLTANNPFVGTDSPGFVFVGPDGIWIPPGSSWVCTSQSTNSAGFVTVTFQDVPVAEGNP